jgi:hypothetical protein
MKLILINLRKYVKLATMASPSQWHSWRSRHWQFIGTHERYRHNSVHCECAVMCMVCFCNLMPRFEMQALQNYFVKYQHILTVSTSFSRDVHF